MYTWWYLSGWGMIVQGLGHKLSRAADFFSLGLLLRTLFEPFKQISNGQVDGAPDVRFQAFLDRLFSRIIGTIVRLFLLIFGLIAVLIEVAIGLVLIVAWPIVPLLPVAGIILAVGGWQ